MARDERLFLQITIDMHRHPKIQRLPVEARWAFIEMLGEARIADNDGVFDAEEAEFLWPRELLDALMKSHPSKPLLMAKDGKYAIRDYAKHQVTKGSREELSSKRSLAGKAGAAARWGHKDPDFANGNGMASAKQVPGKRSQAIAESESESELELERLLTKSVSLDVSRASKTDGQHKNSRPVDPRRICELVETVCDIAIDEPTALKLSAWVVSQSPGDVQHPHAYTERAIKNDPMKITEWIETEGKS